VSSHQVKHTQKYSNLHIILIYSNYILMRKHFPFFFSSPITLASRALHSHRKCLTLHFVLLKKCITLDSMCVRSRGGGGRVHACQACVQTPRQKYYIITTLQNFPHTHTTFISLPATSLSLFGVLLMDHSTPPVKSTRDASSFFWSPSHSPSLRMLHIRFYFYER